mgnify:CR=1 FL=1
MAAVANERRFYDEHREIKPAAFTCPFCRQSAEYEVHWLVRQKKARLEGQASEEEKQRFARARSYMVRVDDVLVCQNPRCCKRFEIPTLQSVILL